MQASTRFVLSPILIKKIRPLEFLHPSLREKAGTNRRQKCQAWCLPFPFLRLLTNVWWSYFSEEAKTRMHLAVLIVSADFDVILSPFALQLPHLTLQLMNLTFNTPHTGLLVF